MVLRRIGVEPGLPPPAEMLPQRRRVDPNLILVTVVHPQKGKLLLAHFAQGLHDPALKVRTGVVCIAPFPVRVELFGQDILVDRGPLGLVRQAGHDRHGVGPLVRVIDIRRLVVAAPPVHLVKMRQGPRR